MKNLNLVLFITLLTVIWLQIYPGKNGTLLEHKHVEVLNRTAIFRSSSKYLVILLYCKSLMPNTKILKGAVTFKSFASIPRNLRTKIIGVLSKG